MARGLSIAAAASCLAAGAAFAPSAGAAVTFGSSLAGTPDAAFNCSTDNLCTSAQIQFDPSLGASGGVAAPTDGVVVRWRIKVGTGSQPVALRIVRPELGGTFSSGGVSSTVTPAPNATTVTPTRLRVRQDDRLGLDCCQNGSMQFFVTVMAALASNTYFNPVVGTTAVMPSGANMGYQLTVNADLEADADGDGFGDETQDDCLGSAGPDDGCPVPETQPLVNTPATPAAQTPAKKKSCKKKKGKKTAAPYAKKGCKKPKKK